jgi:hypothetical protein
LEPRHNFLLLSIYCKIVKGLDRESARIEILHWVAMVVGRLVAQPRLEIAVCQVNCWVFMNICRREC